MILHITTRGAWEAARSQGEYRADSLAAQGFVHCSTGRQVRGPLRARFADVPDLVLLGIDESLLPAEVRYEEGEPGGDLYPHVYGPVPVHAVTAVERIPDGAGEGWPAFPPRLCDLVRAARGGAPEGVDEWRRDGVLVTTDRRRLDMAAIHRYLSGESYWARGVPRDALERAMERSICLGALAPGGEHAGFARVVTDGSGFAWLADVHVLVPHRGRGLGVLVVECALMHPDVAGVRMWVLGTRDAHGLYARFGFAPLEDPRRWMVLHTPGAALYGAGT